MNTFWLKCSVIATVMFCSTAYAEVEIDLARIMAIESGGDIFAFNPRTSATGPYQITPICLKDYNEHGDGGHYYMIDLADVQISKRIAYWYINTRIPSLLGAFGVPDGVDTRLWAYNGGIKAVKRGFMAKETRDYIERYHNEGVYDKKRSF